MTSAVVFFSRIRLWAASMPLLAFVLAGGATAAGLDQQIEFNIGAQSLASALIQYSSQANVQVVTRAADVSGEKTAGVVGKMSADEALKRLLDGTRFSYVTVGDGTVEISATQEAAAVVAPPVASSSRAGFITLAEQSDAPSGGGTNRDATGHVTLVGHVTVGVLPNNLPGALVRIQETGETTETDDLGNFRIRGLAPGEYTVSIYYLGYVDRVWRVQVDNGAMAVKEFSLERSTLDVGQVTVFGTRSARALALNQQRTKENSSSIISADMLGNFTGTTISEALRRTEGISFQRDALTGDGTGISIRGLSPDFNAVKLNGVSLPSGLGRDNNNEARSADLSYLLADSIAKITVNYSLLPSHDSAGTGGLVEIETKSPLDRPHRFSSFSIEGARKGSNFGKDFLASGTISGTFGAERDFGLSASAQYRRRDARNFNYSTNLVYGPFLPLDSEGGLTIEGTNQIDPRISFPFEPLGNRAFPGGVADTLSDVDISNLTASVAGAWHVMGHTDLRLDLQRSLDRRDSFSRNAQIISPSTLLPQPVVALGGEVRNVLGWGGYLRLNQNYDSAEDVEKVTDTYAFNGTTALGKLDFNYRLGYASGSNRSPKQTSLQVFFDSTETGQFFDPSFVSSAAVDPIEHRIISVFGERTGRGYPSPHLTPEGFAFFNNSDNYYLYQSVFPIGRRTRSKGYNYRADAASSARYNVDGSHFKYLEAGFDAERSKFAVSQQELSYIYAAPCDDNTFLDCASATDIGMRFTEGNLSAIGGQGGFMVPSRGAFEGFADNLASYTRGAGAPLSLRDADIDPLLTGEFTLEDNLATYLQGRVDLGRLEIIGGARLSHVKTRAVNINKPILYREGEFSPDPEFTERYTQLFDDSAIGTDLLPRVLVNFRFTDNLVARAGYFLTVARPSVTMLSLQTDIFIDLNRFYGPAGNQPVLGIGIGNPGLKPAKTDNFDLSIEFYHGQIGLIRASAFFKRTKHNIQTNYFGDTLAGLEGVNLPDIPELQQLPDDIFLQGGRPENSRFPTDLWGGTVGVERQFTFLPGFWGGFGIQTNFTYTGSKKHDVDYRWGSAPRYDADGNLIDRYGLEVVPITDQRYSDQSDGTGSIALTYNRSGIDGSLAYTDQARSFQGWQPNGLGTYTERFNSLDLRMSREIDGSWGNFNVFLEATDLLKGTSSSDLENSIGGEDGVPKFYTNGSFIGGRSFRLGLRANF